MDQDFKVWSHDIILFLQDSMRLQDLEEIVVFLLQQDVLRETE